MSSTKESDGPKNTKIVVYLRVSTAAQNNLDNGNQGLITQNIDILNFCIANSLIVSYTVEDICSAYSKCPDNLNNLINKIKNVPILVYSVNRFSRNIDNAESMINKLHKNNSYVYSVTEKIDSRNKLFMELVKSGQKESELHSTKMLSAIKRIKLQNGYLGPAPFGYKKVRIEGIYKLVRNPVEQSIIRKINKYVDKYSENKVFLWICKKYPQYNWTEAKFKSCLTKKIDKRYISDEFTMAKIDEAIHDIDEEREIKEIEDIEDNVYMISEFRRIGIVNGNYMMLVKWKGYANPDWTDLKQLYEDMPNEVVEYLNNSGSITAKRALIELQKPKASKKRRV